MAVGARKTPPISIRSRRFNMPSCGPGAKGSSRPTGPAPRRRRRRRSRRKASIAPGWLFARKEAFRAPFRVAKSKTVGRAAVPVKPGQPPQKRDIVLEAGAFSQQMAQPWQADFLMCRSEVPFEKDGRKIGWWPVQRPEKVFLSAASDKRLAWARHENGSGFGGDYL